MNTQSGNSTRVLMWMAGIAVIVFSIAGVAAIMGWIPTSMGRGGDGLVNGIPGKISANAPKTNGARTPVVTATPVAAGGSSGHPTCAACGVVESTRTVTNKGEGSGIGVVGGAVVGGLLGNQIGSGRGNTAATAIGAVGGAMAGNEVEKRVKSNTSYEVTVRMDDGSSRVISEASPPTWHAGDHVRIVNGALQSNT